MYIGRCPVSSHTQVGLFVIEEVTSCARLHVQGLGVMQLEVPASTAITQSDPVVAADEWI